MRLILTLSVLFLSPSVYSQFEKSEYFLRGTTSSAGSTAYGYVDGKNVIVQQSIGQSSIIGSAYSSEASAFQGFIQPNLLDKVLTPDVPQILEANLYPNPFVDQIFIEFDVLPETDINLNFFDIMGSVVWSHSYSSTDYIVVEPKNLSNGYYFLKVECDGVQRVEKILKNK
tara:strand:+ start:326 stop:838 length:513 start_codon:yes stop_codon:yes gene_type:complete